ncbi:hypothetical protein [Rhizobium giardinii]|uniref:Uncharacterized protein n=1 Tax=Rhizobium giardinii TaxID=56731 RepID=A0A7W8U949_9HYPH|nr:hypothetical protein [Rhizobium giardinii]MBB5535042.1 hypothetical protein [Rhizobium giardinii]
MTRDNSSSERQRRYRERRQAGLRVIWLEIDEVEVSSALERLHFLSPQDWDDDEAVRRALNKMIRAFCRAVDDA